MSEQEIALDKAIELFQRVDTFDKYKEGLIDVIKKSTKVSDPHKARERVMKIVDVKKNELMKNNTEFKAIMDRKKQENKQKADYAKAAHKAKMAEAKATVNEARFSSMSRVTHSDKDIDDWVAKTRIKIRTPEEAENVLNDKLGCPNPKCGGYGENRGNVVNDVPTCMGCWHRLVPKSEFKEYNRSYWRKWNKKKKRKRR